LAKTPVIPRSQQERGEAMSVYEAITLMILAMMFVLALVRLMIYIADLFSKRK